MPVPRSAPGVNRTPDLQVRSLTNLVAHAISAHRRRGRDAILQRTPPTSDGVVWAGWGHSRGTVQRRSPEHSDDEPASSISGGHYARGSAAAFAVAHRPLRWLDSYMSDRVLLTRDGLAISVAGPEDDCIWLRDFLGAAYCSPIEERLRVGIALVPGLDVPTVATTRSRLAFVLDSGPVRLPAFPRADGERLLDAEATVAFDVGPGRYETTVRYGASRFAARVRLMLPRRRSQQRSAHTI